MKISIGNDHAGPEYKKAIVKMLEAGDMKLQIMVQIHLIL
jgi:ribose 5-phosphate isomerase RpiB